jgi:hypothetical protein
MKEHLVLLGFRVRDKVTGFTGVCTHIGYDLYGCIQAIVVADMKDGIIPSGQWFDIARLEKDNPKPLMKAPDYSAYTVHGGADKPSK